MKVLNLIILLLLAIQPKLYGQDNESIPESVEMRIDSVCVYRDDSWLKVDSIDKCKSDLGDLKEEALIWYGYYVSNIPTGHTMSVYILMPRSNSFL